MTPSRATGGTASVRSGLDGSRVLVTGGAGLLGGWLLASAPAGVEVHATRRRSPVTRARVAVHDVDLADPAAAADLVATVAPDVVVHTAYDKTRGERDVLGAAQAVAAAAAAAGARLVHLSTDVVFDGTAAPYAEDASPAPVEEYGGWKAAAESAVTATHRTATVVRTSLIISTDPPCVHHQRLGEAVASGEPLALYADDLRCPVAAPDLAAALWELAGLPAADAAGVWHLVGPEAVSRLTLYLLLRHHGGHDATLRPDTVANHPGPRPRDLRLSTARADRALAGRIRPIGAYLAGLPEPAAQKPPTRPE